MNLKSFRSLWCSKEPSPRGAPTRAHDDSCCATSLWLDVWIVSRLCLRLWHVLHCPSESHVLIADLRASFSSSNPICLCFASFCILSSASPTSVYAVSLIASEPSRHAFRSPAAAVTSHHPLSLFSDRVFLREDLYCFFTRTFPPFAVAEPE
jgi:hypothetical protein